MNFEIIKSPAFSDLGCIDQLKGIEVEADRQLDPMRHLQSIIRAEHERRFRVVEEVEYTIAIPPFVEDPYTQLNPISGRPNL